MFSKFLYECNIRWKGIKLKKYWDVQLEKDISELKSDLSRLKSDFSKLEADINVSRNVNSKLFEDSEQLKEGAMLTNSILGGNVWKFWVFVQVFCW